MTRRPYEDEELMTFLDGELDPKSAREMETRLAAEARQRVKGESLSQVGEVVRAYYEAETAGADSGMASAWARLDAALDAAGAPTTAKEPTPSLWERFTDWFASPWGYLATGAVGAAAGVLLMLARGPDVQIKTVEVRVPVEATETPQVVASVDETQVDELTIERGTGMVFQVAGGDVAKPATTVIWVNDTDETVSKEPI